MADLSTLMNAFIGEATAQPQTDTGQWQQELLRQVNPEEAKRKQFRNALAAASAALSGTKGNFLTGLSAAAGAGAQSYIKTGDENDAQRIETMRTIDQHTQEERDRKLRWLQAALGVQSNYEGTKYAQGRDKIADDRYAEGVKRQGILDADAKAKDERDYALREKNTNSQISARSKKAEIDAAKAGIDTAIGRTGNTPLTSNQRRMARDSVNKLTDSYRERRYEEISGNYELPAEERSARLANLDRDAAEYKRQLEIEYELVGEELAPNKVQDPAAPAQQSTAPGKVDAGAASPPPAGSATPAAPTATNPKTGEKMIFKDGKWQPMA